MKVGAKRGLSIEGLSPQEANRFLRIQLAAAHHGLAEYGMNDRVVNHLSVMSPAADGNGRVMLITPFPVDFKDVTPSSLLGIDTLSGEVKEGDGSLHQIAGSFHLGFYQSKPDTVCMMHTHSPYVCALASLEDPKLLILNQSAALFYQNVAYDYEYGGLVADLAEGKRLGSLINDCENLIMVHHGSVSTGTSVARAFNNQIALEISAKNQILAMQTGRKLREIPEDMSALTASQMKAMHATPITDAHLKSIIDRLAQSNSEFQF